MKKLSYLIALFASALLLAGCSSGQKAAPAEAADYKSSSVVYELNIRQMTPEGTFAAAAERLPVLRELGVDILWVMPPYPIGELNRKGTLGSYYAIRDYCDINPEFGTLERIQAHHRLGGEPHLTRPPLGDGERPELVRARRARQDHSRI